MFFFVSFNFQGKSLILFGFFFRWGSLCGKKVYATTPDQTMICKNISSYCMLQNFTGQRKKDTPFYADIYFNVTKLRKKTSFVYGYFENVTSIVMSCCKICVYTHPGNSNYNLTASPIACTDMTRLSRDIFCHSN